MIRRLRLIKSNQKGITLVDVLVATALMGIITGVLGPLTYDILWHSDRSNAQVEAVCGIEEAARWISNDGQRAQMVDFVTNPSNPEFKWVDPESGESYQIIYSLSGTDLQRSQSIDEGAATIRTVAGDMTGFSFMEVTPGFIKVSLSSTGGSSQVSETREYYVTFRATF